MRVPGLLLALAALFAAGAWLERIPSPGPQPEGIASDGTHLYVADFIDGTISRADPAAPAGAVDFPSPGPHPEGLAWDGSHLWSADWETGRIYRHQVSDTALTVDFFFDAPGAEAGTHPVGLTWDGASLWLTTWSPFMLYRLDPATGAVLGSRRVEGLYPRDPAPVSFSYAPEDLAWDGTHLWITDWYTPKLFRIDPTTFEVVSTLPAPARGSVGLTFHRGYLWNGSTEERALYRLEVTDGTPTRPVTWGQLKRRAVPGGAP